MITKQSLYQMNKSLVRSETMLDDQERTSNRYNKVEKLIHMVWRSKYM